MPLTVTTAEARADFSRIANAVAATGEAVTVFKHSRPWVQIAPVDAALWSEIPNAATQTAMEAAESMRGKARFSTATELLAAMEQAEAALGENDAES
jgi:antitoxin (DNA-binding transcriptional repressor) of toxin-antitoxin stability system